MGIKEKSHYYWKLLKYRLGFAELTRLLYIAPENNWSVAWDGYYITSEINEQFDLAAEKTTNYSKSLGNIIHFGSLWGLIGFLKSQDAENVANRNKIVGTVFHGNINVGEPEFDDAFDLLVKQQALVDRIVVSTSIMEKRLKMWGIAEKKIIRIPLGVDVKHFVSKSKSVRIRQREYLNIPDDKIVIGSFQKDGNGWGEGLTPKLIKGPDLFLDVVAELANRFNIFVLLTGPARGYVKAGLDNIDVPYLHQELDDYLDLANYFQCLDLYLLTSREEGGPKSVLEAPACGVPLVTTNVGMVPDIHEHGKSAMIADVEDIGALVQHAVTIIEDDILKERLIKNSLNMIENYDWHRITAQYYEKIYAPLLAND